MSDTWINGNRYDFTTTSMSADGNDIPVGSMKSLNVNSSLEPGIIQGNSVFSPGRTSGYYTATADFEILMDEADAFEDALTNGGSTGLLQTDFDIEVSYALAQDAGCQTISLRGCRIKTHGVSGANGNDATYVKYELTVMRVLFNGRPEVIQ